jgi:hypothetical protein
LRAALEQFLQAHGLPVSLLDETPRKLEWVRTDKLPSLPSPSPSPSLFSTRWPPHEGQSLLWASQAHRSRVP